ncbi:MAG: TonB family protein [Emcibacter sp.]|nr:TonB family protein [Emcibacter sp.]
MFKRYSASVAGAFAITFSLFLGMNYLVAPGKAEKPQVKKYMPFEIGKVREATDIREKIKIPDRITNPIEPINIPSPHEEKTTRNVINPNPYTGPKPTSKFKPTRIGLSNGDIQPLRKFAPAYPRTQASRGIEGYVIVQFTVNKMGAVENIVIVESTNAGFNKNSMRAVSKYKYKPRIIDGVAVEVHNVIEKISFKLETS